VITKADLLKAVDGFADMASEAEMRVLGELVGLQLLKAHFVRRARSLNLNAEQLAAFRRDIAEQERQVLGLVQLLNETDAEALDLTRTQH